MTVTEAQIYKLLSDPTPRQFSQLGFSLLVTRMKGLYKSDPTPTTLTKCTDEINAFLKKFGAIMHADISILSKL